MSEPTIEIIETTNTISVETNLTTNNNIEIELVSPSNVEIINSVNIPLVGDLPQGYPLDWTVGNLPISRLSGLIGTSGINYSSGIISLSGIPINLLPVQNLLAGSGIDIANNQGIFTVAVTGQFGLTGEQVDDRVSSLLVSGNYTTLNYDDENNKLTISVTGLQPSGNYSVQGHQHSISDVSGLQLALDSKQPSGNYANSVHSHISSEITDFSSSVDSRITLANLQPSGNYSIVGHSHIIGDVTGLQIALDNKQPSGIYASGIHYHVASDITDFNSSVSGLLPASFDAAVPWTPNHTVADGTRYLVNDLVYENGRLYKANYENESIPTSSTLYWTDVGPGYRLNIDGRDIPNIPYPVKNIISGSGISVSGNNGDFTVAVTGQFGLTSEQVDDRVSNLLVAGSNIILNYDDLANQLTISTSGLQPSGNYSVAGHSHTSSDITDFSVSVSSLVSGIYAPLNSPALTGIPTAPTAPSGTNDSQIANTSFVRTEISSLVNSAPSTLDTLNELASALGNDPNFATTIASGLGQKANLVHNHTVSNISDFNSAVSGLLPVKNILGGTNVSVTTNSGIYTVAVTGQLGLSSEQVDDRVNDLLKAGSYIFLSYDDNNNSLTISSSGLQPSGDYSLVGHTHIAANITDFNSATSGLIDSSLSTSISGGAGIDVSYYSNTDTLLISTSGVSLLGHQHTYSEITDFNTGVRLNRINDLTIPSGNVSFNNYRLTNLATPTSGTDAVNKNYIDTLYASSSGLGIASFSSNDFSVASGAVTIKNSGVDNNQLAFSYITLGSSTINLGSSITNVHGLILDGGSP